MWSQGQAQSKMLCSWMTHIVFRWKPFLLHHLHREFLFQAPFWRHQIWMTTHHNVLANILIQQWFQTQFPMPDSCESYHSCQLWHLRFLRHLSHWCSRGPFRGAVEYDWPIQLFTPVSSCFVFTNLPSKRIVTALFGRFKKVIPHYWTEGALSYGSRATDISTEWGKKN